MVISVTDMRVLEVNTVALGIPLAMLMEAAGKSVADVVINEVEPEETGKVMVLAGKGGNGGDALVAARYLASRGYRVEVILAYSSKEIEHPDTLYNYRIASRLESIKIHKSSSLDILQNAEVIIDGLLGTGVRGELRDPIRSIVEASNKASAKLKIAIDTPTGLNPDTGEVHGVAFKADKTVTFHDVKPGLLKSPEYTGDLVVANIGIPQEAQIYVGPGDLMYRVPTRPSDIYKGKAGRIAVIGGSQRFTGAPALSGLAALATGSDLAFIITPDAVRGIIASYSPELITLPYRGSYLGVEDVDSVLDYIERIRPHVVVLGPGLGDRPETIEAVKKLIFELVEKKIGLVIDADALKAVQNYSGGFGGYAVLTPHRGEFRRLYGGELTGKLEVDGEKVAKLASDLDATVLLKAPIDIISDGNNIKYNKTGNPYMSTGGTGDVLSGIVASLLAWTKNPYVAAYVAAYVNGVAGDYLLKENKTVSPTKMIEVIPAIIRDPLSIHRDLYLG